MQELTNLQVRNAPSDHDMERSMLAGLILRPAYLAEVREILDGGCFDDPRNREIYHALLTVTDSGRKPDMFMIGDELKKHSDGIVDQGYYLGLCTGATVVGDPTEYAMVLRDLGLRRRLWETGLKLMAGSADRSEPVEAVHSEAKEAIDGTFDLAGGRMTTLADAYKELQEQILINQSLAEGQLTGTPTGFQMIDRNGGLCRSDLIVVGAETSMGKTSFATALAVSAIEHGESVAFYSMEMQPKQLAARIGAMKSNINASRLLYGRVEMGELQLMDAAMEEVPTGRMYFDGSSTSSLDKILFSIRMMKLKKDISGAVVDYLQLVSADDRGMSPEQRAARIARDLKNLAKELDIWIIAISQLSRNPQNPVPSISRLRDSGQIEEAADTIFLVYRPRDNRKYPEPFSDISTEGTAMVKVAKGRNIGTGEFICGFKEETTKFYPLSDGELAAKRDLVPSTPTTNTVPVGRWEGQKEKQSRTQEQQLPF